MLLVFSVWSRGSLKLIFFAFFFFTPSFCNYLFHFACKPVESVLYLRGNKRGITEVEKEAATSILVSLRWGAST